MVVAVVVVLMEGTVRPTAPLVWRESDHQAGRSRRPGGPYTPRHDRSGDPGPHPRPDGLRARAQPGQRGRWWVARRGGDAEVARGRDRPVLGPAAAAPRPAPHRARPRWRLAAPRRRGRGLPAVAASGAGPVAERGPSREPAAHAVHA